MTKIHIDTDIGGDIDDLCALAMVLLWQGVELTGVTTVAEHVGTDHRVGTGGQKPSEHRVGTGGQKPSEHSVGTGGQKPSEHCVDTGGQKPSEHRVGKRACMVRYVLGLAGQPDIPVAAGAEASLACYRSWQGLPDDAVYWPEAVWSDPSVPADPILNDRKGDACIAPTEIARVFAPEGQTHGSAPTASAPEWRTPAPYGRTRVSAPALDLLERSIAQGAVIVAIGPFTNLALLEQRSPGSLQTARLVLMGGYVFPPRPGYPAWSHEMDWNVQVDVQSALLVLEHSYPTLVPLAVTAETALRRAYLPRLRQSGPLGQLIARQAEAHASEYKNEETYGQTCSGLPPDIINFQHDPLACAIALGWDEGVEIRDLRLKSEIRDGWLRQAVDEGGKPARLVTAVDGERFNEFWLDTVTNF
jgi:inosine-uridine nucleoside N-ribohydrolase